MLPTGRWQYLASATLSCVATYVAISAFAKHLGAVMHNRPTAHFASTYLPSFFCKHWTLTEDLSASQALRCSRTELTEQVVTLYGFTCAGKVSFKTLHSLQLDQHHFHTLQAQYLQASNHIMTATSW